ncbi:hypothetical protein [Runella limosa]|uniref:hypothetical protein n=1 Tax=Runella limosa TaxID=370978 RepID=UPI001B7FEC74|nr:hypothetical protein [Runella limosa]
MATLIAQGKEKIESPNKPIEGKNSVPALHVPWVYRNHPMLSKPVLPLSLDPIRFTLHASQPTISVGEEVEITITAQLLDIPASSFFVFEEQKSFSLKLLLPKGFVQTGGDYQEYIGAQLSTQNNTFTKRIRGVFTSLSENPCFVLLRGAYHANSSSVFEQKQVLCLTSKKTPQATRVADCVSPVLAPIAPQTICYGGAFYMVSTSVSNGVEVYYQWYNDNGPANNNTNPIAGENRANLRSFPTSPGEYKYKVVATSSANASCTASQTVILTINAAPTITATTSTNPNCAPSYGGSISVTGAGGTTFLYSKDNGGNWVDLTGSNSQNEITRNTMLSTPQKDVAKVKITLEEGFGLLPGGEYTGEIRNESSAPTFDGLAAGTYSIRVKNENGCISAPTAVTLSNPNAPAIFNITGGGACFTNGAPINLSGSATGINYYLVRNGVAVTGAIAGTGGVLSLGNHSTEGTYTVVATNPTTGCSAQMSGTAVVSAGTPSAPTIDSEATTVCAGQSITLTTSSSCAGTLVWSPSGGTLSNNNTTYTVSPSVTTSYSANCHVNDCISEASNSLMVTVTTLAAPTIGGENSRTLCPDTPVTLVATGCSSTVSWSYTLSSGAAGTLAFTGNSLELTFAGSTISAWNEGDVLSLRATCTSSSCVSPPSNAVEVVKQASCSTSTALADCAFYIKAADAQGTETTKLTRTGAGGSTFQPLTLSAQTLESTSPTGVTYSWTGPGITTPLTTAQISATQVGEYKLVLTPTSGTGAPCELYITLSGVPCTIPTAAACGIPTNITPSDQGGPYLASLAPGDQFTANDYVITVTSVTITPPSTGEGTGVGFSGEGYARMKLTNGFSIDVPVVFGQANGSGSTAATTPIKLNTCYQLVEGTVFTQFDPSWANIADVDNAIAALDDAKELIGDWLESFQGTPDQMETFNENIKPLLTPYADDPRVQDAITKLEQLTTACPNYQPNATQTTTCQAAIDAAKAAYVVLQEFIDDLPPFPGYLLPGVLSIPGGRVLSDAPDETVITVAALNACAIANCNNQTDPVRRFWGQVHGPSYDFWSVFSNGKKYYVMRTYENLYQEVYYYVPYGGSEYKVFYPNNGQTSAAAFADAGAKLVFDVGVMIATGGGASVTEAVVTNVADAFISALEESNGDLSQFNSSLATNLAFSSLDFAEAAGPVFKNLVNKFKPNWGAFTQAARNRLNTLRSQTGWVAQVTSYKNSISPKLLPNYGKVVKGTLSTVVNGLSSIGAKIDHKNKQILDAAGNTIATFQGKVLKFTDKVIPQGWINRNTLVDVEVEEIVNGVAVKQKRDVDVWTCPTFIPPQGARIAANECIILAKRAIRLSKLKITDLDGLAAKTMSASGRVPLSNSLRIKPDDSDPLISKINDIIAAGEDSRLAGELSEQLAEQMLETDGFKAVAKDLIKYRGGSGNGFDNVLTIPEIDFTKPLEQINLQTIIINESKTLNGGKIKLKTNVNNPDLDELEAGDGIAQMSDVWIRKVANSIKLEGETQNNINKIKFAEILLNHIEGGKKIIKSVSAVDTRNGKKEVIFQKIN